MTRIQSIESDIRQLHARCADTVWRKDSEGFANCYTADGEWIIAGFHFRGRAEIARGFLQFLDLNQRVLMHFATPILTVDDTRVCGRTYVTEDIKTLDGRGLKTMGVYHENFARTGEQWLFERREFDTHYFGPPDFSGSLNDCPDRGPPGMPE